MGAVAFTIFGLEIYWYGIIISVAIIVAFVLASFIMRRIGFRDEIVFEVLLCIIPLGIFGARLFYVISDGMPITEFFNFRSGGIAIYGAIIAGALGILLYTKVIRKCSFFAISDIVVLVLILAQSIGRWGNYFNQEVYGLSTGSFHFFPLTVMVGGTGRLALFFYESILNLIGFFILYKVFTRQKNYGTTSAVYLIIYGTIRMGLELLRDPAYILDNFGFPVSFVISIVAVVSGIVLLYLGHLGKLNQNDAALRAKKET